MNTIEITNEDYTTTERNYAWYSYNGIEGILAYDDCEKVQGIEPVQEGYSDNINFYSFESLKGVEITAHDVCGTLSDCYDVDCAEQGGEIDIHYIMNPENEQCLLYAWEYNDMAEDDLFKRMLCVETNKYYDWISDRTKFIKRHEDKETFKAEAKAEWEEICSEYEGKNHFSEAPDFDEIWKEITDLRDVRNPDWDKSYIEEGVNYFTSEEEYHKEAEELEVDYYLDSDNMADYKHRERVFRNDNEDSEPYKIYGLKKFENQFFVCTDNPEDDDMFFLDVSLEQVKKFLIYRK